MEKIFPHLGHLSCAKTDIIGLGGMCLGKCNYVWICLQEKICVLKESYLSVATRKCDGHFDMMMMIDRLYDRR